MGRLYDLIQEHIDSQRYPVDEAQVAREIGVSQTAMTNWANVKGMVKKEHLQAIARVTGNPYRAVRDAWLEDVGLLHPDGTPPSPGSSEESSSSAEAS